MELFDEARSFNVFLDFFLWHSCLLVLLSLWFHSCTNLLQLVWIFIRCFVTFNRCRITLFAATDIPFLSNICDTNKHFFYFDIVAKRTCKVNSIKKSSENVQLFKTQKMLKKLTPSGVKIKIIFWICSF